MTQTCAIHDFAFLVGQTVTIRGWAHNVRSSGKIAFLQIRDGSGFTQAIVDQGNATPETWEAAQQVTLETSLILTGTVAKHPKKEEYELHVTGIELVQVAPEYPIGKKEHGPDFLLDNRHLWLRAPSQWAIQRIRNAIIDAHYSFFAKEGFIKIDSPILTPNACEGTTELFEIDYFDEGKGYLSQSGQLYLEAAIFSVGKCFDFGPVFRAEKSKTRRHLTEFWMMDAEAAFVEHDENLAIQERLVKHIVRTVLDTCQQELAILERDTAPLEKVANEPFIRRTHAEVVKELQSMGSDIKENDDLGADDETMLMTKYQVPMFVEKYPAEVKAFYMKRDPENPKVCLNADLLAPEGYGEVIGGSQREDNYDVLLGRIKDHKLPVEFFDWYLDLRKYGSVPHSGFGLGLERVVTWLCGIHHLRESIPFPRMINRIRP